MISLLNPQPNERIDLADFKHLSQDSVLGALRALPSALLTDPKKQPLWVIRGFTLSNPSGQVLSVARGSALLSLRRGAQILTGIATDDGQVTQAVDLSSYAAGTYGVFIRFVLAADSYDTRAFFRASGGGEEYGQSVPTRLNGNWEVNVVRQPPGEEWLQIGAVTTPSMALVDRRPLYFEGRVDQATASGWGSADDRSADRSAHGLGDLQTALAALRQSIEDVKGPGLARWYSSFVAGQSIGFAGTQVAGRTQWLDASFYAQGDAARPRLTFAADGAHLAYTRASALLAATGAELPTAQGSTTTALALRSGSGDEALLRGGFYRSSTNTGFAAADASWSRGVPGSALGGIGFYGAQGQMGGAGVGLGYSLGGQAPSLFVGASGNVGVNVSLASRLLADARAALQVAAASGQARGLAVTDGALVQALFAYSAGAQQPGRQDTFTGALLHLPTSAPLLIVQGNNSSAYVAGGSWAFGLGAGSFGSQPALSNATVYVTSAPQVVASVVDNPVLGPITNYAQTASLVVDNGVPTSSAAGSGLLPARMSFAQGGTRLYDLDASTVALAANDVANGQGIWSYGRTAKVFTMGVPLTGPTFRGTQQGSYTFSPAVSHQDAYPGNAVQVMVGTAGPTSAGLSYVTLQSVNNAIRFQLPVRAMVGQQATLFAYAIAISNTAAVTGTTIFSSYSIANDADTQIFSSTSNFAAGTNVSFKVGGSLNSPTSAAGQCWNIIASFTSSASFRIDVKYLTVDFTTSSLNPQRQ